MKGSRTQILRYHCYRCGVAQVVHISKIISLLSFSVARMVGPRLRCERPMEPKRDGSTVPSKVGRFVMYTG